MQRLLSLTWIITNYHSQQRTQKCMYNSFPTQWTLFSAFDTPKLSRFDPPPPFWTWQYWMLNDSCDQRNGSAVLLKETYVKWPLNCHRKKPVKNIPCVIFCKNTWISAASHVMLGNLSSDSKACVMFCCCKVDDRWSGCFSFYPCFLIELCVLGTNKMVLVEGN